MLDTHSMIKKLQAAGVPEKQAEAQVTMVFEIAEKTFATKADTNKIGEGLTVLGTNVTKLDEKVTRLDATVTKLGADVTKLQKDCATKDDLKAYATKKRPGGARKPTDYQAWWRYNRPDDCGICVFELRPLNTGF